MAAFAYYDATQNKVKVSARLFFYGEYATNELGQMMADEIMRFWNLEDVFLSINGIECLVEFEVGFVIIPYADLLVIAPRNRDYRNNFIRIEKKNAMSRSMMGYGLGDNAGHWLITDNLGNSTTAAHEFGHALGLPHPSDVDFRGSGTPPIMAPRGTLVDSAFQWNPAATAGEYGGTMNPIFRKVRKEEILAIFHKHDFSKNALFNIGKLSNTIFDQMANPIPMRK